MLFTLTKDLYKRQGKGRRCCLGDIIYSILFRASYFPPGWFEEWWIPPFLHFILVQNSKRGKGLNKLGPLNMQKQHPLHCLLYKSFFYGRITCSILQYNSQSWALATTRQCLRPIPLILYGNSVLTPRACYFFPRCFLHVLETVTRCRCSDAKILLLNN